MAKFINRSLRSLTTFTLLAIVATLSTACDKGGSAPGGATAPASAPPKAPSGPTAGGAAAIERKDPPTATGDLVPTDLSPRGAEWAGFKLDAPKDAKVMDDLGDCRVAVKGFDVVLSQKKDKSSVATRKKGLTDLAKMIKGKVSFENETPDGFDFTMETPKFDKPDEFFARKSFFTVVKVGGKSIGCFPHDSAMPEEMTGARAACATLKK